MRATNENCESRAERGEEKSACENEGERCLFDRKLRSEKRDPNNWAEQLQPVCKNSRYFCEYLVSILDTIKNLVSSIQYLFFYFNR